MYCYNFECDGLLSSLVDRVAPYVDELRDADLARPRPWVRPAPAVEDLKVGLQDVDSDQPRARFRFGRERPTALGLWALRRRRRIPSSLVTMPQAGLPHPRTTVCMGRDGVSVSTGTALLRSQRCARAAPLAWRRALRGSPSLPTSVQAGRPGRTSRVRTLRVPMWIMCRAA